MIWIRCVTAVAFSVLFAAVAVAQDSSEPWVVLTKETLDGKAGEHKIEISAATIRSFGVKVVPISGKLVISRVVIRYANGQQFYQNFDDVPLTLEPASSTHPFDERESEAGGLVVEAVTLSLAPGSTESMVEIRGRNRSTGGVAIGRSAETGPFKAKGYGEVEVFFGTSRLQEPSIEKNGREIACFGTKDGDELKLGRAVVTVPFEREVGSIPKPDINLVFAHIRLRAEDPLIDFTLAAVDVLPASAVKSRISDMASNAKAFPHQAFVFIHGYNVSFEDAVFRTAQIAHDIGFDGAPITFSWPSSGGLLAYNHDRDMANASEDQLRELLRLVASVPGVEGVNIVAHSMGNMPLMDSLNRALDIKRAGGNIEDLKLREIVFAAPDVSRNDFDRKARGLNALARGGITLYASANDRALQLAAHVASGVVRAGDVPIGKGPLIVPGIETVDVSNASTSFFSLNHSLYADRHRLVQDIGTLFGASKHPPDIRGQQIFLPVGLTPKQYWKYLEN